MVASPRNAVGAASSLTSPPTLARTGEVPTPSATSGTAAGLIEVGSTGQPAAIVPLACTRYARPEPPTPGAGCGEEYDSVVPTTMSFTPSLSTSATAALEMIAFGANSETPGVEPASKSWIGKGAMRLPSACQT